MAGVSPTKTLTTISSRQVIENVYGRPNKARGQLSIEAFLRKKIKKPAPIRVERLSENGHPYSIDLSPYDSVNYPRDIGGLIAFKGTKGAMEFVVNERGSIIGRGYTFTGDPVAVKGRIFFQAGLGKKRFIVNENGKKIGGTYDLVGIPREINGIAVFRAKRGIKSSSSMKRARESAESTIL